MKSGMTKASTAALVKKVHDKFVETTGREPTEAEMLAMIRHYHMQNHERKKRQRRGGSTSHGSGKSSSLAAGSGGGASPPSDEEVLPIAPADLDVAYITPRVLVVGCPWTQRTVVARGRQRRNNVDELKKFLDTAHEGRYCLWNLSGSANRAAEQMYDYATFGSQVVEFNLGFVDLATPTCDQIFRICYALRFWLSLHADNVAVIHGRHDEPYSIEIVITCYLLFKGKFDNFLDALEHFVQRRMLNDGIHCSRWPASFRRCLIHFHSMRKIKMHVIPLRLNCVIVYNLPRLSTPSRSAVEAKEDAAAKVDDDNVDGMDDADAEGRRRRRARRHPAPLVEVFHGMKTIFSTAWDPDAAIQWDEDQSFLVVKVNTQICGDFGFVCYEQTYADEGGGGGVDGDGDGRGALRKGSALFRFASHTAFATTGVINLDRSVLDMGRQARKAARRTGMRCEIGLNILAAEDDDIHVPHTAALVPTDLDHKKAFELGMVETSAHHAVCPDPLLLLNGLRRGDHEGRLVMALQMTDNDHAAATRLLTTGALEYKAIAARSKALEAQHPAGIEMLNARDDDDSEGFDTAEEFEVESKDGDDSEGNTADVCALLKSLGLEDYVASFNVEQIDMKALRLLGHAELKMLGLKSLGTRAKLINAVETGGWSKPPCRLTAALASRGLVFKCAKTGVLGVSKDNALIGKGHSAIGVYCAFHQESESNCAIKVVEADTGSKLARAKAEAKRMAKHNHPNIVRYFESWRDQSPGSSAIYITRVQLCDGTLDDLLMAKRGVALPVVDIHRYTLQIAHALAYLHCDMGQLHRDVKLDNLFLDFEGVARLGDFGEGQEKAAVYAPAYGQMQHGHIVYQAPEELDAHEIHGRGQDCWALGLALVEMLCGRRILSMEAYTQICRDNKLPIIPVSHPIASPVLENLRSKAAAVARSANDEALAMTVEGLLQARRADRLTTTQCIELLTAQDERHGCIGCGFEEGETLCLSVCPADCDKHGSESFLSSQGLLCTNGHFYCAPCVDTTVKALADGSQGALKTKWVQTKLRYPGQLRVPCPTPGCVDSFDTPALAPQCSGDAFKALSDARLREAVGAEKVKLEKEFSARMEDEVRRRLAMGEARRKLEESMVHIKERLITLRCPRCNFAFGQNPSQITVEGCMAMQCPREGCMEGKELCFLCFRDCGQDPIDAHGGRAHPHVARCELNPGNSYFVHPPSEMHKAHARLKTRRVCEYLRTLEPAALRSDVFYELLDVNTRLHLGLDMQKIATVALPSAED